MSMDFDPNETLEKDERGLLTNLGQLRKLAHMLTVAIGQLPYPPSLAEYLILQQAAGAVHNVVCEDTAPLPDEVKQDSEVIYSPAPEGDNPWSLFSQE